MSDYYQILGIEETASEEEIEARWAELMNQYRSRLHERGGKVSQRIKEVKEAYEVLRDPSRRKEYDLERSLKRSILKQIQERRKERGGRKKRRMISVGIVLLLILVGGFLVFTITQLTIQYKPMPPTSVPVPEEKRPIGASKPVPREVPETPDKKASETIPQQIARSQETIPPVAELPRKELELKEKIAKEAVKTKKIIPREMPKPEVSEGPKPVPQEGRKVEEPKPAVIERPPATAYVPVPEKVQKSEVAAVIETKKPEITAERVLREVPKEVLKEAPKELQKEPLREVPKEVTKEVSRVLPKEAPKTVPQELPVPQPSRPKEVKPPDQTGRIAQIPSAKPSPSTAAIPPMPHPFVKEDEVRQFLAKYVNRYKEKDIEGFLSFFSPMAIQNQKDGIEEIRKIYSRQFELYDRFEYQLRNPKIEIFEKSAKVRASYEIEQFSKKGEVKELRGEIEWDLVKEAGELKILAIQYRTIK